MKNLDIMNMYEGLNLLMQDSSLKFPAKVSFAIIRNLKILFPIVKDIEDTKLRVIKNYGKEENGNYIISLENREKANEELNVLANIEIEISLIKINLKDIENLDIPLKVAKALSYMLEEEI